MVERAAVPTRFELHGVVHPSVGRWSIDGDITIPFADGQWTISVREGNLRVLIERSLPEDPATFTNEVIDIVRGVLDALGYHLGIALTPELRGGLVPPNGVIAFRLDWAEAAQRHPDDPPCVSGEKLQPFIRASTSEPQLRRALADLHLALARPDDTAFYAYRAVECVRQYFVQRDGLTDSKKDRVKSWQVLRDTLGFTEEELTELGKKATTPRHGGLTPISETERLDAILLARRVVSAFVDYLNSESTPE